MKIKVYQCETDDYLEMEVIGKYKYVGESNSSLTNGKEYYRVKGDTENEFRIVDDTNEDYIFYEENFIKID